MRLPAILRERTSFRGMAKRSISRRSQRAFLSLLFILGILRHAVEQQKGLLQQQFNQQNITKPIVTDKVNVHGLGNARFLLPVDEKRQGGHCTPTTLGRTNTISFNVTSPTKAKLVFHPKFNYTLTVSMNRHKN
jgi:hypothetical protein